MDRKIDRDWVDEENGYNSKSVCYAMSVGKEEGDRMLMMLVVVTENLFSETCK